MTLSEMAKELIERFEALLARNWILEVLVDGSSEVSPVYLMGGDCNCPYPKHYDPADGHGFTYLNADDFHLSEMMPESVREYNLRLADAMIARAVELEGKPKTDKVEELREEA